jgi:FtsZ-binding cell division protein ZapB
MSEQVTLESLNLKKPLEKMTAKELRDLAINKIPQITGASGMGKDELLSAIKEVLGIDEGSKVSPYKEQIWGIKREIRELKAQKEQLSEADRKQRDELRQRIKKLKRKTRRLAAY